MPRVDDAGGFLPRCVTSIIAWIWPAMSCGERAGTSVSSISFSRFVCTPRPLTSRPATLLRRGDLVNFINVNDAVLRACHVAVGAAQQFPHQVLHVAADVARLGKFRRVALDERHADQIRDAADQIGFAHAGRADENDVLLGVIRRFLALKRQPHLVIMVAQRHAQDFFRLLLLDDKRSR